MIGTAAVQSAYIYEVNGWFLNFILWAANGVDSHFLQCVLCMWLLSFIYAEIASKHFRFAEMLYYKVLESVIEQEQKRLGDMDLSVSKSPMHWCIIKM